MDASIRPSRALLARAAQLLTVDPAELRLAGFVNGALWALGACTVLTLPLIPGAPRTHAVAVMIVAACGLVWGALVSAIVNRRPSPLLVHGSTVAGLVVVPLLVSGTGGHASAGWVFYFWVALYAAYFFTRRAALVYLVVCIGALALPLAYDGTAMAGDYPAELIVAAVGIVSIGGAVIAGRDLLGRLRAGAERAAAEQATLHRVATAVIGGEPAQQIYALAAREAAGLLGAQAGWVLQFRGEGGAVARGEGGAVARGEGGAVVRGCWTDSPQITVLPGFDVAIRPGSALARVCDRHEVVRTDLHARDSLVRVVGCLSTLAFPIELGEVVWGALVVGSTEPAGFTADDERQLRSFNTVLATAVANVEDRAQLAVAATTDPLTGLSNQRALHQRLTSELAGGARRGLPVSVAMLDIDHFKEINDTGGHALGDEVLREVAACLQAVARADDTVGRSGGDEFMWIMPGTCAEQARGAVERARRLIARAVIGPLPITASAGVCDSGATRDVAELVRLADIALYASKSDGRDRLSLYNPALAATLGPAGPGHVIRDQALAGLRALARAIDAKDPATREHSERVSLLAARLAQAAGWSEERVELLREAALVHDVGKLAVPDVLLSKAGMLTRRERVQMSEHAELSARIVDGVLTDEQVSWIGFHHERPDGRGYPLGVRNEAIPDGAAMIALADAVDVMTVGRTYSPRRSWQETVEECAGLAGRQFTHAAVAALLSLAVSEDPGRQFETGPTAVIGL